MKRSEGPPYLPLFTDVKETSKVVPPIVIHPSTTFRQSRAVGSYLRTVQNTAFTSRCQRPPRSGLCDGLGATFHRTL
ncbi:hypothetical protein J6590_034587 [Homalodisca vitripennis]|nr:hypothetical protein J6590_034587 [Homalodisca vitripennis]